MLMLVLMCKLVLGVEYAGESMVRDDVRDVSDAAVPLVDARVSIESRGGGRGEVLLRAPKSSSSSSSSLEMW